MTAKKKAEAWRLGKNKRENSKDLDRGTALSTCSLSGPETNDLVGESRQERLVKDLGRNGGGHRNKHHIVEIKSLKKVERNSKISSLLSRQEEGDPSDQKTTSLWGRETGRSSKRRDFNLILLSVLACSREWRDYRRQG